jgi:hypothetical protein
MASLDPFRFHCEIFVIGFLSFDFFYFFVSTFRVYDYNVYDHLPQVLNHWLFDPIFKSCQLWSFLFFFQYVYFPIAPGRGSRTCYRPSGI